MSDHVNAGGFVGAGYPPEVRGIFKRQNPAWAALDVGSGWWALLARLDARLAEIDPDYTISQVKEKLGGLNYNASTTLTGDTQDDFYRTVRDAEREAAVTCDRCGRRGVLRVNRSGVYQTLCDNHSNGFQVVADATDTTAGAPLERVTPPRASTALTEAEVDAAIAGGVPDRVFTPGGLSEAVEYAAFSAETTAAELDAWLSAQEVSSMLGVDPQVVVEMGKTGDLATAVVDGQDRVAFAPWQFTEDGRVLPGISQLLHALPRYYSPSTIQNLMETGNDAFGGRAPRAVMTTSGGVVAVLEWARDLGLS